MKQKRRVRKLFLITLSNKTLLTPKMKGKNKEGGYCFIILSPNQLIKKTSQFLLTGQVMV